MYGSRMKRTVPGEPSTCHRDIRSTEKSEMQETILFNPPLRTNSHRVLKNAGRRNACPSGANMGCRGGDPGLAGPSVLSVPFVLLPASATLPHASAAFSRS